MSEKKVQENCEYEFEMENFIRQVFEQNYEELRLDSGHAISPDVKQTALNQVLLYWRILREIAENVTDTEVRLSLPGTRNASRAGIHHRRGGGHPARQGSHGDVRYQDA